MKIDRDPTVAGPLIKGFSAGRFRVDDLVHDGAMMLTPERAVDWSPPLVDALAIDDVALLLELSPLPEFLLLGTGSTLCRPPPAFVAALDARGVGVEPMDSRAASRAWGLLRGEGRWIAAALYRYDRDARLA